MSSSKNAGGNAGDFFVQAFPEISTQIPGSSGDARIPKDSQRNRTTSRADDFRKVFAAEMEANADSSLPFDQFLVAAIEEHRRHMLLEYVPAAHGEPFKSPLFRLLRTLKSHPVAQNLGPGEIAEAITGWLRGAEHRGETAVNEYGGDGWEYYLGADDEEDSLSEIGKAWPDTLRTPWSLHGQGVFLFRMAERGENTSEKGGMAVLGGRTPSP